MASTGLLGINPYQQGVSIDVSSKPNALAFQIEQKEALKRDALQKYLMDYEKSLNPAGMRSVDQDAFLSKLNEAKQYNLKNTRQILNPSKYGSEFQSTYTGLLKEAQSLIEQSKIQGADDKIVNQLIYDATQKGKTIHDGLLPSIEASRLSILDPRFKKINPWELNFDEKYDDASLMKNVWGNVVLPTRIREEKLPDGRTVPVKETYLNDDTKQVLVMNGIKDYTTIPGAAKYFNELAKNPDVYNYANKEFGDAFAIIDPVTGVKTKPEIGTDINKFIVGYVLSKKPVGDVSSGQAEYDWLTKFNLEKKAADNRQRRSDKSRASGTTQPQEMGNELDNIEDINFSIGGGVKNGIAVDAQGNAWSGEAEIPAKNIPGQLFDMIGVVDPVNMVVTYKDGMPVKIYNPKIGTYTRKSIENYQMKFNTEPGKGPQLQFGRENKGFTGLPKGGKFD